MVYDRTYDDQILSFEASGGLMDAALVMRDRETDSWWGMMKGISLGGPFEGRALQELEAGEKLTWGEWKAKHPTSLVLSIDGVEHEETNPYANYFDSEDTFRGLEIADNRLPAKAPIFSFRLDETSYAVPHESVSGGKVFQLSDRQRAYFHRQEGASVFASTTALLLPSGVAKNGDEPRGASLAKILELDDIARLPGFDTFWYTWAAVNEGTVILGASPSVKKNPN